MPSLTVKRVMRHRNGFATIRQPRSARRNTEPEYIHTPNLTQSSYTESETASTISEDISPAMSPSLTSSSFDTASEYHTCLPPSLPDLSAEVNPFLLPPGAFPGLPSPDMMYPPLPLDAYIMGTDPQLHFDEKARQQLIPPTTMPRPKKKTETRVLFSDEDSVISVTETSDTSETITVTETSDTETERTARSPQRSATHQRAKSIGKVQHTKPAKSKVTARSTSVPPAAAARAMQVRRRRANESPKPSSKRVPSKAAREDSPAPSTVTSSSSSSNAAAPPPLSDDLLGRVTSAIPDLHLLLSRYKDANGELGARDALRRRLEAQLSEMVRSKDETIQALMGQLEEAARQAADEASGLHSRVEELERKQREMQRMVEEAEERAGVAESRMRSLEEAERSLVRLNEQLSGEKAAIIKSTGEEKDRAMARLRKQLLDDFNSQGKAMRTSFERDMAAVKQRHEGSTEELKKQSEAEKKELEAQIAQQQEKFGADMAKQKEELESKLAGAEKKLNQLGQTDAEIRVKVEAEWKDDKEKLSKLHEEELETLRQHHRDYCNEQMRGFVSLQERLNRALIEENENLKQLLGSAPMDPAIRLPPPVSVEEAPEEAIA